MSTRIKEPKYAPAGINRIYSRQPDMLYYIFEKHKKMPGRPACAAFGRAPKMEMGRYLGRL